MTVQVFLSDYMSQGNEFAYDDGVLNVGIFPYADGIVCCHGADDEGVTFDTIDDVLNKFIIDGKPFRDILPTLDDKLL